VEELFFPSLSSRLFPPRFSGARAREILSWFWRKNEKKHLQIFFPLIRHTLLLSNLWKYLYKCNTRDDLEKDQTRQRIRSEVTRARTHILCVCAWARMKDIILRARVIFAIEGRAERVAEREGRWGGRRNIIGGEAPWYVTRGKRPRRRGGEGRNFFSFLWLPLSHAFPFCSGIRSRIHETTSAACRRSIEKLGVIAALDFQPEMTIEHRQTLWKLSFFLCK